LPWAVAATVISGSASVAVTYVGLYVVLRASLTWIVGVYGLKQKQVAARLFLIPVWDVIAFAIWLVSFTRRSVRWRGSDYYIRSGQLVPVPASDE
jgi:ceramide glucosyltransferase